MNNTNIRTRILQIDKTHTKNTNNLLYGKRFKKQMAKVAKKIRNSQRNHNDNN